MQNTPWPYPDGAGRYGEFGGRYVPETLMGPLAELEAAYAGAKDSSEFHQTLRDLQGDYVGRPTPL